MKNKIYIFGIARYSNGKTKKSRRYINPDAFSRWANAQWRVDNNVTIDEIRYNGKTGEPVGAAVWHQ